MPTDTPVPTFTPTPDMGGTPTVPVTSTTLLSTGTGQDVGAYQVQTFQGIQVMLFIVAAVLAWWLVWRIAA